MEWNRGCGFFPEEGSNVEDSASSLEEKWRWEMNSANGVLAPLERMRVRISSHLLPLVGLLSPLVRGRHTLDRNHPIN